MLMLISSFISFVCMYDVFMGYGIYENGKKYKKLFHYTSRFDFNLKN